MTATMPAAWAAISGLGLGLSLLVVIGAQNTFVLRQGLRGDHVPAVVSVCILSDALFIAAGVGGMSALLEPHSPVWTAMLAGAACFLFAYAILAAYRAARPATLTVETTGRSASFGATLATCLAMTWLNPAVYLDTVVVLGSAAHSYSPHQWFLGVGAMVASLLWFTALGYGARFLRPTFARPLAWRILDSSIAIIMTALAVGLLCSIW